MADDKFYCKNCNSTKSADNFYLSNNLEKYPEGKVDLCKKCMTLHVDNWDPQTYLWILQEIDVPYIPEEWNKLLANYGKDRSKVTGLTILGRYLSKMKLKQYRDFRWNDTDHLQELANNKIEQTMKRQGYGAVEIAEAINKATFTLPEEIVAPPPEALKSEEESYGPVEDYFDDGATDALVAELTEEDRLYLRLKWGKAYKPDEWIELEKLYQEMRESYDIQTAAHKDTLKLICKTSLKANQLIDMGDIEGYQKMSKVYDTFMKSGKFTAQQNKDANGEYVDSVSELVALCERDAFIPRYYTDTPQDKVDRVIQDLQDYTRNLVLEELHLGPLIEKAIRNNMAEADKDDDDDDEDYDEESELERSLYEDDDTIIEDEDYSEYADLQEELEKSNEALYSLMREGKA